MEDLNIRLYAADVSALSDCMLYEKAVSLLDDERRIKTERMKNASAQRLSVGAGILLRQTLQEAGAGQVSLIHGENGKPYLEGRKDLFFNLSHSGEMVICAIAPCEIGCDIERIRSSVTRIAERYFTDEERDFARISQENFFRMWTLKESFLKVTGKGLSLPLKDFNIGADKEQITVSQKVDNRTYAFKEYYDFDGYCCSVCTADMGNAFFEENVRICDINKLVN